MSNRYYSPNEYTQLGMLAIPPGDHRVKIINVVKKVYRNSGKDGFEITLKVSGHRGLLWYYLIFDPEDEKKNNKKLSSFFKSFHIQDFDLSHYDKWIGQYGAVRVCHSVEEELGLIKAYVYCCLTGWQQSALPAFRDVAWKSAGIV